jgi:hypothetical protein
MRTLPAGFIEPCLPTKADTLPSGGLWLHEIKHDGYGLMARQDPVASRLLDSLGHGPDLLYLIRDAWPRRWLYPRW